MKWEIIIAIAFGCLSGLVLALVALLPQVWRTGQKGIILSVSSTSLVISLCFSLLFVYVGVITTITYASYMMYHWDDFSKGEGGIGYRIDEPIHHNRDAIAQELWLRRVFLHLQERCFTADTTICKLTDQIESRNQFPNQRALLLALSIISATLTCVAATSRLIKKQAAETQNPERTARFRRRKNYLVIALILIWLCVTFCSISGPVVGDFVINSMIAEVANRLTGQDGSYQVTDYTDAQVIPGTTLWVGPWRSTLAPGIAIGLGVVMVIELALLKLLEHRKLV